ncbi:contactin-2-like [Mya arenaria]|uniref:contactin-2-like n=1 Tax=Mya arenaria TaxID=6604 RepID=UPI0022E94331|nr:contactin-2-like [Mya arenaria]
MSDSSKVSMEQTLIFANIDRKQTGYYRCTASNYMEPTRHDASVGISSNTVYIDVQYEAEVASFTLLNANHGQNFEVNENTQVIFYCQAHSNPSSNLALLKQSQYLKTASDAKQLDFTISKSVCEDEGIYQCTAQNEHNTKANIRSLELFVRCAPRASALSQRDQNVTIAPGEPAAFTLKLVAFPRPRAKDFVWEKKVSASSTWNIVSNDTDIVITISTDGLQTKLFFSSVDEKDFGYYRVHVNNELGNYTETFLLQAQDDSAGSVIAGAVCGTLAVVVVVTVVVVILRRKYTVNCNFERKRDVAASQSVSGTDSPENNAAHTYDEGSMPNAASVYDALKDRGNGPDDRDLYTPLDESSSKNAVEYENVKKEDPVYTNMRLTHSVQTVL